MNRKNLESAAVAAHAAGMDWAEFWPTVAGDVGALGLDYYARGQLVHRLIGLVASGDCDGMTAAGDWFADDGAPTYPASDDGTAARLQITFPGVGA